MRIQRWLAPFLVAALTFSIAGPGRAQTPFYPAAATTPAPGAAPPWQPAATPAGYSSAMPAAGGPGAPPAWAGSAPYSPEMLAWPTISPYDNRHSQHYMDEGLWHWNANNDPRCYFLDLTGVIGRIRRPDRDLVGFEGAPAYFLHPLLDLDADPTNNGFFGPVSTGNFQGGLVGSPVIDGRLIGEDVGRTDPISYGFRAAWGFTEPDETGLEMVAWLAPKVDWLWRRGLSDIDPNTALGGVHTDNAGLPVNDGFNGVTVRYDRLFKIEYGSTAAGGDGHLLMTPRWQNKIIKVRPLFGARVLYIGEKFQFEGRDSGAMFNFPAFPDNVGINDPDPPLIPIPFVDPYVGRIDSVAQSYLAGPQIGLRFDMGGENLKIVSFLKGAVMVNYERLELTAVGIGDPLFDPQVPGVAVNPFYDPNLATSQDQQHTHVSPLVEWRITAEAPLFQYLPVLKRWKLLENARFRLGYSILAAFEIASPHQSIIYNGAPLVPELKVDRIKWYIDGYDLGIHWEY